MSNLTKDDVRKAPRMYLGVPCDPLGSFGRERGRAYDGLPGADQMSRDKPMNVGKFMLLFKRDPAIAQYWEDHHGHSDEVDLEIFLQDKKELKSQLPEGCKK